MAEEEYRQDLDALKKGYQFKVIADGLRDGKEAKVFWYSRSEPKPEEMVNVLNKEGIRGTVHVADLNELKRREGVKTQTAEVGR